MTERRAVPSWALIALWCAGVGACVALAVVGPEPHLRHPAVTGSAGFTVVWMLLAWGALLGGGMRFARLAWTLGLFTLFVHLGLAFGVAHGWSHAAAVEHVRAVGGTGAGIVVNYLFVAVWAGDVAWWWADPAGHARRPRWAAWTVHGFLLFVVVNATVIFGPAERRWAYAAALVLLTLLWVRSRSDRPPQDSARTLPHP
jgi:hypothetical protein